MNIKTTNRETILKIRIKIRTLREKQNKNLNNFVHFSFVYIYKEN